MGATKPRELGGTALLALVVLFTSLAGPARAHEGLHERLARLDAQIGPDGRDAALLVERAGLHRLHGDWLAALDDLHRAAASDPGLARVELERARVFAALGNFHAAAACIDAYLASEPRDGAALAVRAGISTALARPAEAVRDLERALELAAPPTPELVLDLARARIAAGRAPEAASGLDAWIERLGPTPALVLCAVDVCVELGRYDEALERLAALAAKAPRQETWLVRRGEILERAGRAAEARAAFEAARRTLDAHAGRKAQTQAVRELAVRIDAALARLAEGRTRP